MQRACSLDKKWTEKQFGHIHELKEVDVCCIKISFGGTARPQSSQRKSSEEATAREDLSQENIYDR